MGSSREFADFESLLARFLVETRGAFARDPASRWRLSEEIEFFDATGRCGVGHVVDRELEAGSRVVHTSAHEANLFVAQFIGSPPLNLLEGEALREIAAAGAVFTRHAGRPLLLGVRPADVLVHAEQRAHCLAAEVTLTEPTGSDLWVVGRWRGQRIKGRAAPGARLERGATAHFSVPPERVYFFAAETGTRLRPD